VGPRLLRWRRMRKAEIARRLARQSGVSSAEAADQLDRVVHQILSKLKNGKPAPLPGLGRFTRGPQGVFQFEWEKPGRGHK
jgi:nucleoid DNA-binding protein